MRVYLWMLQKLRSSSSHRLQAWNCERRLSRAILFHSAIGYRAYTKEKQCNLSPNTLVFVLSSANNRTVLCTCGYWDFAFQQYLRFSLLELYIEEALEIVRMSVPREAEDELFSSFTCSFRLKVDWDAHYWCLCTYRELHD